MSDTHLTGRQILMVVLIVVILLSALMVYVFVEFPTARDPAGSRRAAISFGLVGAVSLAWFLKLRTDAIRDRRRGIRPAPARTGRFNLWFGAAVLLSGVGCSILSYQSAANSASGTRKIYWGLIIWGIFQMAAGLRRMNEDKENASQE